jgi:4-hydroxy-4-methyl-2-oxoglutarate aldolase
VNWIEYLKSIDTPTLANAVELTNRRPRHEGFTPLELRCLFPELGRMCGYAVTAQVETVNRTGSFDLDQFIELYKLVEAAPKPAVIVLQEIGGFGSYGAHCGEVMATFFTRLGAVGLVSDCGVRDLPEVRKLGFQYFARGSVASHAHFRIVRSNISVQILGMPVSPGDLLHGDENGLITVPQGLEDELPKAVEAVQTRERRIMEFVRGSGFSIDGFKGMVE